MKVYLDAVSTTALDEKVRETYQKLLDEYYCNSDALYDDGVAIYDMQEKSRQLICSMYTIRWNIFLTARPRRLLVMIYQMNNSRTANTSSRLPILCRAVQTEPLFPESIHSNSRELAITQAL